MVLSPYLVLPIAVSELIMMASAREVASWRRLFSHVQSMVVGALTAVYAGVFEELQCRWMAQPVCMALVYASMGLSAPLDFLLSAIGVKIPLPIGALPFALLGRILHVLSFGMLDAALALAGPASQGVGWPSLGGGTRFSAGSSGAAVVQTPHLWEPLHLGGVRPSSCLHCLRSLVTFLELDSRKSQGKCKRRPK